MLIIRKSAFYLDDSGLQLGLLRLAGSHEGRLRARPATLSRLPVAAQGTVVKALAAWNRGEQATALIYLLPLGQPELAPSPGSLRHRALLAKAGFDPAQARDADGMWASEGDSGDSDNGPAISISHTPPEMLGPQIVIRPDPPSRSNSLMHGLAEAFGVPAAEAQEEEEPKEEMPEDENRPRFSDELSNDELDRRLQFTAAANVLQELDPHNPALQYMASPGYIPTQEHIEAVRQAVRNKFGIDDNWLAMTSESPDDPLFRGLLFSNPAKPQERIRLMPGNPKGRFENQKEPYAKDERSGWFLNKDGERQRGSNSEEVHIPLQQYDEMRNRDDRY